MRATHWCQRYIGLPYVAGKFDCVELARLVQREVFHREIKLPSHRDYLREAGVAKRFAATRAQIAAEKPNVAERTDTPAEGDGVLLIARGYPQHIGIYCVVNGEPAVLHAADSSRQVVLCRLRELDIRGLRVEGFYKWT